MLRTLKAHHRYAYAPIHRRADYRWPDGKRLAVYIGLNLEHFEFGQGLGAKLASSAEPDVLSYAWRDYGNRVGVWRLLELFETLRLPIGLILNTSLYDYCPEAVAAFRERGDEIIAHGHTNAERQSDMGSEEERRLIVDCTDRISCMEGRRPAGWLSPWISESFSTPDLSWKAPGRKPNGDSSVDASSAHETDNDESYFSHARQPNPVSHASPVKTFHSSGMPTPNIRL
ncbi:MAG: hypothetical protein JO069_22995 [Verrucomicrobia bacterium]|nr:hypothetical protein [Verrucomicrobiota bacterium]